MIVSPVFTLKNPSSPIHYKIVGGVFAILIVSACQNPSLTYVQEHFEDIRTF